MNFNYQKARETMVENQLRPNKIKDQNILNLFKKIPKENFLPNEINEIPYSDLDINLISNRGYLKNLHIAQLINSAEIKKTHKILHIGSLTGYVTVLLANLCFKVTAIEINQELKKELRNNINSLNVNNINIAEGSFEQGYADESPYNIIFIDTPIKKIDDKILNQLEKNFGKVIMIKKNKNNLNKAIKITRNKDNYSEIYLFDVFSKYELFKEMERLEF